MRIRQLAPGDEAQLEAFLVAHRDSSMFLRGNVRRAGLEYQGKPFQAIYAGAFRQNEMVGVVAHSWSGMLLIQAPELARELGRACVDWSQRPVTGLTGPRAHVGQVSAALEIDVLHAKFHGDEWSYALDLAELVVPTALSTGSLVCRAPNASERDTLCAWRLAYDMETLGADDSEQSRQRAAGFLDAQIADQNAWVAIQHGVAVSLSALNAALPDIVQLGGIYTPPELRGRGFAKAAVAASLLVARERGATRAVLFTSNPSAARTYEALGFKRIGDYSLILLH